MSFTYSGTVKEITDGLAVALPAFQQDGILTGAPVGAGSCVVAPSGASGSISGGTFSVSATDDPSVLTGYRLVLTAELANAATDVARVAFRSPDLFRTGSGWTENDLDIWLHVIDDSDLVALAAAKIDFPLPLPYSSLQSQLSPSLPKGVVVTGVQGAKGLLSISMQFHQGSFPHSLSGSFTVSVTPDTSSDYQSYISLQLVDLNLDGLTGWVAEFTSEDQIRSWVQTALDQAALEFSSGIATQLAKAQEQLPTATTPQLTLTLVDVAVEDLQLNATPVLGLLQHSIADPCQVFRDRLTVLKQDLGTAKYDGLGETEINGMNDQVGQFEQKLSACVAAHHAGPTQPITSRTGLGNVTGITELR